MSVTNTISSPLATLSSSSVVSPTSAVGGITASSPGRITSLGSVSSAIRTGYSVTATRWTRSATSRYSYTSTRSATRSATATPASPGFTSHSGVPWFGFAIPIVVVGLSLTIGCLVYAYRLHKLRKQIEALPEPDVEATGDGAPPPYMANASTSAPGIITPGPVGMTSLTRSTSTPAIVSRFRRDSTGRLVPTGPEANDTVPAYTTACGPTAPAQTDSDFIRSVRADPFLSGFVRLESSESTPRQPARPVQSDGDELPTYEAARAGR